MFYIVLVIYIFDMILFFHSAYISIKIGIKASSRAKIDTSKIKEAIQNQKNLFMKILVGGIIGLVVLFIILLIIGILSIFIWLPLIILFNYGVFWGIISMSTGGVINAVLKAKILRKRTSDKKVLEAGMLADYIFIITIFLTGYVFSSVHSLSLPEMIQAVYELDFVFNNALVVLFPASYFAFLVTNVFLIVKRVGVMRNKNLSKYKPTTKRLIIIVIIASSFIGLFYLNELDLSYIADFDKLSEARNLFLVLITAIFIPALFSILQDKKQQVSKTELTKKTLVENQEIKEVNDEEK